MAVYTPVTQEQLAVWLKNYSIGTPLELKGISSGVENSNFFLTTTHGQYVLTLFEKLTRSELPFYIHLMAHLARHGIPCPAPIADRDSEILGQLNGKPAAIVSRLAGASEMAPSVSHCAAIGAILADMHIAGQSYGRRLDNPRGPRWWRDTAPQVMPFLAPDEKAMLSEELRFQGRHRLDQLPRGVVHADLFRDNCLFESTAGMPRVGGIIDFYFAGNDVLLFDVAVTGERLVLRCNRRTGRRARPRVAGGLPRRATAKRGGTLCVADHAAWGGAAILAVARARLPSAAARGDRQRARSVALPRHPAAARGCRRRRAVGGLNCCYPSDRMTQRNTQSRTSQSE